MGGLEGRSQDEFDTDWVPVEPGLFDYPVAPGAEPRLLGNRCGRCSKTFFPAKKICPHCGMLDHLEDMSLTNRGVIYASTVVRVDSPAGIKAPYAYGYVDISEDNVRVFALFTGSDVSSFVPGRKVRLVLEPLDVNGSGKRIIAYKFKLA